MEKRKRIIPIWTIVVFILGIVSGALYLAFCLSEIFAEFYNNTFSAAFRWFFAKFSGIVNFSLIEMLLFLSPVIIISIVVSTVKSAKHGISGPLRTIVSLLALCCYMWVSFVNLYAAGYRGVPLAEKMELDTSDIGAGELSDTMLYVALEINKLCEENDFPRDENGLSLITKSYDRISLDIVSAYDTVKEEYGIVQNMRTRVKPVILSEPMTYTHISGVYSFYTGEANINTNFPDYIVVSTMAHEMAHQRGIAPEDEASFAGYLALINSDDPYLQYCGYLDVYSYLSSALYESGSAFWSFCKDQLCDEASRELKAYSEFFEKYRDNAAHDVTESVNDTFLQSQGTEGTVAYDLVTELVVAYTVRSK